MKGVTDSKDVECVLHSQACVSPRWPRMCFEKVELTPARRLPRATPDIVSLQHGRSGA